jgi:EmrB/QacA subfamily drug resistance transporter
MNLSDAKYKRAVMVVYILGVFIQIVDSTVVNVAIPTLADEFGVSESRIAWTVTAYLLSLATFIPAAGWLGDKFGTKRMFLLALGIFTGASALCGAANSLEALIAFRFLQGVGAGLLVPIGSAMLYRAFPQAERAKASTIIITVVVIAPAIGPVLGGLILEQLNWRWIFFLNLPLGAAAFVLGWLWLKEYRLDSAPKFDGRGFVLGGVGLAAVLYAISEGPKLGWTSPAIWLSAIGGVGLLVALVVVELRIENPLLKFSLYQDPIFRTMNIISIPAYMGFMGLIFIMPLYLQNFRGFGELETGLALFPQPLGVMVANLITGRFLFGRFGPRKMMLIGMGFGIANGLSFFMLDDQTSLMTIRLLMFTRGLAMGMIFVTIQACIYAGTSIADTGRATSLFSANRQTAPAFGVALSASLLVMGTGSAPEAPLGAYQLALGGAALMYGFAFVASLWVKDSDALWSPPNRIGESSQ